MSDDATERRDEGRPRATGSVVEPDAVAARLLQTLCRTVIAVAALEKPMQLELSRLTLLKRAAESAPGGFAVRRELDADRMSGGQLLKGLRGLGCMLLAAAKAWMSDVQLADRLSWIQ